MYYENFYNIFRKYSWELINPNDFKMTFETKTATPTFVFNYLMYSIVLI